MSVFLSSAAVAAPPEQSPAVSIAAERRLVADAPALQRGRAYYPALDGLRGVAFLLVFAAHYLDMPWAWFGVELFFVLSGFLITGILLDTEDRPDRFRSFYIRRTLRIFPLYYAALLFGVCFALLVHVHLNKWALLWPVFLGNWVGPILSVLPEAAQAAGPGTTIISADKAWLGVIFGHFWSLCVEEQFYLVWPAVVFFVRSRSKLLWICALLIVACPVTRLFLLHLAPVWTDRTQFLYFATPVRVDALMLGAGLALLKRRAEDKWLQKIAPVAVILGLLVWSFVAGPNLLDGLRHRVFHYPAWQFTWGLSFLDMFSLFIVVEALRPGSLVYRIFTNPVLSWIGRISFGAYVFHYIPITIFKHLIVLAPVQHKMIPTAIFSLAATLALACLSFRYFESPFIRLKSRLAP